MCMQGIMHVFMCVCVFKEHFVVPPQYTFTKHLLCARMGLGGSVRDISWQAVETDGQTESQYRGDIAGSSNEGSGTGNL